MSHKLVNDTHFKRGSADSQRCDSLIPKMEENSSRTLKKLSDDKEKNGFMKIWNLSTKKAWQSQTLWQKDKKHDTPL